MSHIFINVDCQYNIQKRAFADVTENDCTFLYNIRLVLRCSQKKNQLKYIVLSTRQTINVFFIYFNLFRQYKKISIN